MENRVDPDQLASSKTVFILISWLLKKPADQDPQCFPYIVALRVHNNQLKMKYIYRITLTLFILVPGQVTRHI